MKKKPFLILIAVLLFFISRFLYLFFLNESDIMTDYKLIEGHYTGVIAKHLLEGLIMPFWDYQYSSYDGGTLISGLIIAPFFLLLGQTSFAVSFYCIFNSFVIFLLWIGFVYRYFGERIAWIIALLFIFAPPNHIKETLGTAGNHMEVNFFIILVVRYFFKIFYKPEESLKRPPQKITQDFLCLGFWAGLGVYFCYSTVVSLFFCFLIWLTLDKRGLRKMNYVYLCMMFLLGICFIFPRLTLFDSFIVEDIFSQWPLSNFHEFLPRMFGVVFRQLPELFAVSSPIHSLAYYIFMFSVLIICIINRKVLWLQIRAVLPVKSLKLRLDDSNKIIFFILFIGVYLLVYTMSDFNTYLLPQSPLHLRYLWLLYPFIFMITAIGIDYIYSKKSWGKNTASAILIYFILAGMIGLWQQLDFTDFQKKIAKRFSTPGYAFEMLGTVICSRFALLPSKSLSLLNQVQEEHIPATYRGFGYEFGINEFSHLEEYRLVMKDAKYKKELYKGYYLGLITKKYLQQTDMDTAYIYEVVSVDACDDLESLGRRLMYNVDAFEEDNKDKLLYGVGIVLAIQCGLKEQIDLAFMNGRTARDIKNVAGGVENGISLNTQVLTKL